MIRSIQPSRLFASRSLSRVICRALPVGALLLGACAGGQPPDTVGAPESARVDPAVHAAAQSSHEEAARALPMVGVSPAVRAAGRTGHVVAAESDQGVPSLLMATERLPSAPGVTPAHAAQLHFARHAGGLGLDPAAIDSTELVSTGPAGSGAVMARFQQRFEEIEVYRGEARVLMNGELALAAIAGRMVPSSTERPRASTAFRLPATEALAATLAELFGVAVTPTAMVEAEPDPDYLHFTLADRDPVVLGEPARSKKVWFIDEAAGGTKLVAAWFVELYAARPGEAMRAWRFVVGAADARVLERRDLTLSDSFDYRVWADATGDKRPLDSPLQDMTPHPTGMPSGFKPMNVAPNLVKMEGFNKNPMGAADPWLPPGAMATQGNNVDAYVDRANPDGLNGNDFRASVTMTGVFDRAYDLGASPVASNDQGMAAVANLFYLTNWLHDYFYDSGFDEKAGNAQTDNFGRGGKGNDSMKAEAQDNVNGGARDNANMSTPADGMRPRMQVYVWNTGGAETRVLTLTPGGNFANTGADFGPPGYDVTADLALVQDGNNPVTDACSALVNGAAVKGKIALIDRGTCTFQQKVAFAEAVGAVGAIIIDNVNANNPPNLGVGQGPMPGIPAMGVRLADGNLIKAALMMGAVKARLNRVPGALADAALDNTVTGHEWGHYLHHRLADCNLNQCAAMSEGWGDFSALHLVLRDGDNLDGVYPMAPYAARGQADSYFGLRRMPYSTDMTRNGLTFKHISNGQALPTVPRRQSGGQNSEVHNAGEVWATMMWEAYVALRKADAAKGLPFADSRRRFADYVVAGLQLTPADATYLEARDALLAAASARNKEDLGTIAGAFAKRGAGSCAKGPARESRDFTGVVESFETRGRIDIRDVTIDDAVKSCDKDGQLDAEESGHLTVTIANGGPVPLTGINLTVVGASAGFSFVGPNTAAVPDIAPLATTAVTLTVALDKSVVKMGGLDLEVRVTAANTCEPTVSRKISWRVNYDEQPMATATDDVESGKSPWTLTGDTADKIWSRDETGTLSHAWHGLDWGSPSDTQLTSPDLVVSASENFVVKFDHKYAFEEGDEMGAHHFYDGALLEITDDGGMNWRDTLGWVQPGYRGAITTISGNALANRTAFVGQSPAWPAYDKASLDFGKAFAGKTVRIRFRISTDQAAGNYGWEIDNLAFGGITNKPFAALVDDVAQCAAPSAPIVANAGMDQRVASGDTVTLDGSGSSGGSGRLSYKWTQTEGPTVSFSDPTAARPTFLAPPAGGVTNFRFMLTVTDGVETASDSVDVLIAPALSDGCCSVTASARKGVDPVVALALLALVAWPRRRRTNA